MILYLYMYNAVQTNDKQDIAAVTSKILTALSTDIVVNKVIRMLSSIISATYQARPSCSPIESVITSFADGRWDVTMGRVHTYVQNFSVASGYSPDPMENLRNLLGPKEISYIPYNNNIIINQHFRLFFPKFLKYSSDITVRQRQLRPNLTEESCHLNALHPLPAPWPLLPTLPPLLKGLRVYIKLWQRRRINLLLEVLPSLGSVSCCSKFFFQLFLSCVNIGV